MPAGDLQFVTVCTMNRVAYVRALLESVTRHHGAVPFVVTIVDAIERLPMDGATVLTGADVFGRELDYAALKFEAFELCRAARPYTLDYLLRHSQAQRFISLDADLYVFAPLDAMIAKLDEADFVVIPYTTEPRSEAMGIFSPGMFAMRRSEAAARFLALWKESQKAFDAIPAAAESVAVLRDSAYNVAGWNLHERSLRFIGDGQWTVDGKPLVSFHFRAFSPERRYVDRVHPAAARLYDFYADHIEGGGRPARQAAGTAAPLYRFDTFPSGIPIDETMRTIFRRHEPFLRADISPWTPEGEVHYARSLLSPAPYTGSLVPILLQAILHQRPDLHVLGDVSLDPRPLIQWMHSSGAREHGYEELWRHRPVIPTAEGGEEYVFSRIGAVRQLVMQRTDVVAAYPDFLFEDAPALVQWLRNARLKEHFLPEDAINAFERRSNGRALARIFSYVSRTWSLMERWPRALIGEGSEELARTLLQHLRGGLEYDLDDVEMFRWIMQVRPTAGEALTRELPIHTTGRSAKEVSVMRDVESPRQSPPPLEHIPPGVNVFGYHRSEIGLGQWTRGLVQSLHAAGYTTSEPVLTNLRMDDDLQPADFLRRKYDPANGTNIFVSYPQYPDSFLRVFPDEVIEGHRNIINLAWEQREGSPYWEKIYAPYHQVWALSDFTAQSLSVILRREVHSVPSVIDLDALPPATPRTTDDFTFVTIFDANSSIERKNPEGVVEAFRRAFRADDRARLIVKAYSADRLGHRPRFQRLLNTIGSAPNIEVRTVDLTREQLYALISSSDCCVSLHRGEGFAYTCAEAMAYAKPVIATAYSGNMQYMNEANSFLVRYAEIPSTVQEGPFVRGSLWADPEIAHAAELMRFVYEHRDEAAARGARGRETVARELSPAAIGARIRRLLGDDRMSAA